MAMSLEKLLAKEGFKERKQKMSARPSFLSETANMPLFSYRDKNKPGTSSGSKKIEQVKSDLSRFGPNTELTTSNRTKGRRSKSILIRKGRVDEGPSEEHIEKSKRVANFLRDAQHLIVEQKTDSVEYDKAADTLSSRDTYKDIYSDDIYSPTTNEREMDRRRSKKVTQIDDRNSMKQFQRLYRRSKTSDLRSNVIENRKSRYSEHEEISPEPENQGIVAAAIQAVISILNGYIKRFLRDRDFRTSFHHNCFASLNILELGEDLITESKVLANFQEAIEVVERAVEENTILKELKKASLQLSVITGLNAHELKDGFTSGIQNSKLSACAHLYLSVVYKIQKKDKVAAKHLLQVFCESPFQARAILLPELWEHMFLPHLVHLREWYKREIDFLGETPSKPRKLKLLEKVYNDIIDSGTYQFAIYYKDWLSEGVEAPSIPSINVPSSSFQAPKQNLTSYSGQTVYERGSSCDSLDMGNLVDPFSPQPVVSRKLYDAVFGRSHNPKIDDLDGCKESDIFPDILTNSGSSPFEEKQALPFFSTAHVEEIDEGHYASHPEDYLGAKDVPTGNKASSQVQGHVKQKFDRSPPTTLTSEANEIMLKRLAGFVSDREKSDETFDLIMNSFESHTANDEPYSNSYANAIRINSIGKVSHVIYDKFDEESFCLTIPNDFVCPLTGQVFEDPVTLETGHTYEREAITEWLEKGNRTCPVSGKSLECLSVPVTNFILKRIIDGWKSEHSSKIQHKEALVTMNQLLNASSLEERISNTKHFISLGGLRFLIQKFQYGNLEEKSHVASMLSYCIEADNACRYYIAKSITKSCLVELIQSDQLKSKENIMLLLVEMMCLNRREGIKSFLSGLIDERRLETLHSISVYLRLCPPEQRPLIAILLLHFDLLIEPQEYSVYREEAVDAIIMALNDSFKVEKVRANSCRALLILGARFSSSVSVMTEDWVLKQSGFLDCTASNSIEHDEADEVAEENFALGDDEEKDIENWLKRLSVSLLCNGRKSFLQCISKCLGGKNMDMARVCLTTVVWLSSALASFPDNEFPLAAFSSLISRLKDTLGNCDLVEHKILASVSLFNLSKIPECKILFKTFAKDFVDPLRDLAEVTWTAKELYAMICQKGP